MPDSRDIPDFKPGEKGVGARRLTELSRKLNENQRAFNNRLRGDFEPPPLLVGYLKLTAEEAVGKFTAKFIAHEPRAIDPAADLTADDIGTVGEDVLAINPADADADASSIDVSGGAVYAMGHLTAMASKDQRRVVAVMGGGGNPHATFRVNLTKTSGSAGNKTTPVSFLYTVTSLAGDELATGKAPEWPSRSENGKKVEATAGLAYRDANGDVQIAIAFERSGTGGC